jgi:RNA polymerase sigma factor (sigma-70 family)
MYSEASDDQLLLRTACDPEAYGAFYRRHVARIMGYMAARSCPPEVVLDLTAEVFAAALVASRRYKAGRQPAIAWLLGIAQHKFADSVRRTHAEERARRKLGMDPLAVTDEALDRVEALASNGWADLLDLLDSLPPHQRDAVRARVVDHRDYLSIARELGCSEAVVRKRVSRGLNNLRVELENSG